MQFNVGDKVKWSSSSGGTRKEKVGVVVHVVQEGESRPERGWLEGKYGGGTSSIDSAWPRDHESYIVRVPSGTKAKDKLYWPRVSKLELVHSF